MELKAQRVVVTRARHQAQAFITKLAALGAIPIPFPVIDIAPIEDTIALDQALARLDGYDWLVLTSVNAVDALGARLDALALNPLPAGLQVAAVGPKTAAALQARGITPDFIPQTFQAAAILAGLGDLHGRMVLLPNADLADDALPNAIQAADGIAHRLIAYRTLPGSPAPAGLAALRQGVDLITFTSPSTVRNFIALTQKHGINPYQLPGSPRFAYIGPVTAAAAESLNLPLDFVAQEHTIEGLLNAVTNPTNKLL